MDKQDIMGKITDILVDIPLSAVLKERLTFEEAKAAAVERRLAEALAENEALRDRLQKAQEEIRVLQDRVELFESGNQGGYHVVG